ncbi:MAG: hypothetical protein KAK00_10305 [Nanoarchaeota archaeon]|nr:hypothetical protein [Nanoarchaeota archaeon]
MGKKTLPVKDLAEHFTREFWLDEINFLDIDPLSRKLEKYSNEFIEFEKYANLGYNVALAGDNSLNPFESGVSKYGYELGRSIGMYERTTTDKESGSGKRDRVLPLEDIADFYASLLYLPKLGQNYFMTDTIGIVSFEIFEDDKEFHNTAVDINKGYNDGLHKKRISSNYWEKMPKESEAYKYGYEIGKHELNKATKKVNHFIENIRDPNEKIKLNRLLIENALPYQIERYETFIERIKQEKPLLFENYLKLNSQPQ